MRHLIRVMRRHDLTKKDLPTYLPTYLLTSLHKSTPFKSLFVNDIFISHVYGQRCSFTHSTIKTFHQSDEEIWPDDNFWWHFLMTIFDDNFRWQFLMTIFDDIFDDNFWWHFLMTIFDDNFWWQLLMTIFYDNFDKFDNFW